MTYFHPRTESDRQQAKHERRVVLAFNALRKVYPKSWSDSYTRARAVAWVHRNGL